MNSIKTEFLNDVKNRFLPLPRNATEGLEHEPNLSDFEIKRELGIGSYGKVYLVNHKKTKAEYALKIIDKIDSFNQSQKTYFNREVEIMYKLNHPNIAKLFSHFEDNKNCYLLMQYIPNGSAYNLIPKKGKRQENLKLIASIMKDLISAIYYMHNMTPLIMHRDIKPENILLDENNKAYLIDFGWSNYIINHRSRYTICGTPFYLPPEMVNEQGHDENADIWCIGVLLFELINGKVPFEGHDVEEVGNNIINLKIKWAPDVNPDAKDLISKILKLNPKERLSIEKILSHKFFTQYFPNAVNELIKPQKNKNRIFVISTDNPNKWIESQNNHSTDKINMNNQRVYNSNNETNYIKKTRTISNISNCKLNFLLSPTKYENNNKENNKNDSNENQKNYNKVIYINGNSRNSNYPSKFKTNIKTNHKYIKTNYYTNGNHYNNNGVITSNNTSKTKIIYKSNYMPNNINGNIYKSTNKNYSDSKIYNNISDYKSENDKFSLLLKKYEKLQKEYEIWKNKELEKLKKELKDIDIKIHKIISQNESCDFIVNRNEIKNLQLSYDNLKIENNKLKEKIKNYENILKNNKNIIANDVLLKYNMNSNIQNKVDDIIKEKQKQIDNYKKGIKYRIEKEKERFNLLINKYNRTLISQERENLYLKHKLRDLENKI